MIDSNFINEVVIKQDLSEQRWVYNLLGMGGYDFANGTAMVVVVVVVFFWLLTGGGRFCFGSTGELGGSYCLWSWQWWWVWMVVVVDSVVVHGKSIGDQ